MISQLLAQLEPALKLAKNLPAEHLEAVKVRAAVTNLLHGAELLADHVKDLAAAAKAAAAAKTPVAPEAAAPAPTGSGKAAK